LQGTSLAATNIAYFSTSRLGRLKLKDFSRKVAGATWYDLDLDLATLRLHCGRAKPHQATLTCGLRIPPLALASMLSRFKAVSSLRRMLLTISCSSGFSLRLPLRSIATET
jgi:hypothetical protein